MTSERCRRLLEIAMPTNKQIVQGDYQAFAQVDVPKVLDR
jgi:hypothetical protein